LQNKRPQVVLLDPAPPRKTPRAPPFPGKFFLGGFPVTKWALVSQTARGGGSPPPPPPLGMLSGAPTPPPKKPGGFSPGNKKGPSGKYQKLVFVWAPPPPNRLFPPAWGFFPQGKKHFVFSFFGPRICSPPEPRTAEEGKNVGFLFPIECPPSRPLENRPAAKIWKKSLAPLTESTQMKRPGEKFPVPLQMGPHKLPSVPPTVKHRKNPNFSPPLPLGF